jgi:NAD(P)H-dependent flavin oxidoreductase YrpB (nitropropane dioxygenase family)
MGVAVSSWQLAGEVSRLGQVGVVSGVALDVVHARRLNDGDPGGHLQRAYAQFPVPGVADRVLRRYYQPQGRAGGARYRVVPEYRLDPPQSLIELTVLANFAEVYLAKEGHEGRVGVNYLEKIQLPTIFAAYGAMLAGVDDVLMGAGIPKEMPQVLSTLAAGRAVTYRITVAGAGRHDEHVTRFDPAAFVGAANVAPPRRPRFLAIIASNTLAAFLVKSEGCRPDGFIVEGPTAGGHNAPPRGTLQLDEQGQPTYGPRDKVDLGVLGSSGLPFWLAGGYASPEKLRFALDSGAAGIQVGSAFALCEESGMDPSLKEEVVRQALAGTIRVITDPRASPSGYPFKVVSLDGTVSDPAVQEARRRVCDLGFLRTAYVDDHGKIGYRCPGEPIDAYLRKGGALSDTEGRKCLCNTLLSTVGLGQLRRGSPEPAIVTGGDDLGRVVARLVGPSGAYRAADVIAYLLGGAPEPEPEPASVGVG